MSILNYRITQDFGYSTFPKVNPLFADNTFRGRLARMYYDHTVKIEDKK